jgi:hypothetical protein
MDGSRVVPDSHFLFGENFMEARILTNMLDLHKSIVGSTQLYLKAGKGILTITSTLNSTLVTRLQSDLEINPISIEANIFSSFLKGSKTVELSIDSQKLSIKSKGLRGEMIFSRAESFPKIPKIEKSIDDRDVEWLIKIIPYTAIKALDKNGFFSANCENYKWSIACSDNIQGAFTFGKGNSNIEFSLTPSDAINLNNFLKKVTKVKVSVQNNLLIVQQTDNAISLAIPLIEGTVQTKKTVTKGLILAGKLDVESLKDTIKIIAPIASTKDASAIDMILSEKCTIKAASTKGNFSKQVVGECVKSCQIKISFELLNNLTTTLNGTTVDLYYLKEDGEITRIAFYCNKVFYLMLTSAQ